MPPFKADRAAATWARKALDLCLEAHGEEDRTTRAVRDLCDDLEGMEKARDLEEASVGVPTGTRFHVH